MREIEYYSDMTGIECYTKEQVRRHRIKEINGVPMTAADRSKAISDLDRNLESIVRDLNQRYDTRAAELEEEFWRDCRNHLLYDQLLNEEQVKILEDHAWSESGSNSRKSKDPNRYGRVLELLSDLTDLLYRLDTVK